MPEEMYEVFLNFSGSDTRQGLVDTLYHSLTDVGIRVFRDSEGLHTGDHIWELYQHIKVCQIYITIFSKSYATRYWCLEELAHMVKWEKLPAEGKRIMPIFYDVTPDNVKLREEGGYEKDLADMAAQPKHSEKVEMWKAALKYVGGISGKSLGKQLIVSFSKSFALDVLSLLGPRIPRIGNQDLTEMKDQVKAVVDKLEIDSGDVRFLVIHGKPGTGKTTLAKLVFGKLSPRFQVCHFLEDIEEVSKDYAHLDNQMLRDIPVGVDKWIEAGYRNMKVLIVLEDVNCWEQIKKLACKSNRFGSGSRIIITTNNEYVGNQSSLAIQQKLAEDGLEQFEEIPICKMSEMEDEKKALEFFSWHAFGRSSPPTEVLENFSEEAVDRIGIIPLSLEILGSYLYRKPIPEWESTSSKLKKDGEFFFQNMLEMIYDSLNPTVQMIFLDIACFFVNKEKTNAMYMWKACRADGIEVLRTLSLVKIVDDNKLWMHSELRDFGRKKVKLESTNYLERSRFWKHKKALQVLKSKKVKKNAQVICLSNDKSLSEFCLTGEQFAGLQDLRFLQLYRTEFGGDLRDLLKDLKWLSWHQCPGNLQARNFCVRRLAILDLSRSSIEDNWQGWQQMRGMRNLKVLNLTGCEFLIRTPEFSEYQTIEKLILKDCRRLSEVDHSIGNLKSLKYLNVEGCDSLERFPDEMCNLTTLTEIVIGKVEGHSFELPEWIGSLTSLVTLEINNVRLTPLPGTIGELKKLERLSLSGCSGLERLPDSIGGLDSLTELDVSNAEFIEFPNTIGELAKLKVIKMGSSRITTLPPAIGSLQNLEELYAQQSQLNGEIPSEIGGLSSLKILDLSSTQISRVPSQICQLSELKVLRLESCNNISELPSLPTGLDSLRVISTSLQSVGDLSNLEKLTDLVLIGDTRGVALPPNDERFSNNSWIENLTQLENFEFGLSNIVALPASFNHFSNLKSLHLCCQHINRIPQLPPSLSMLSLGHCQVPTNLSNLNNLSILQLYRCDIEELGVQELGKLVHFFAEECTFSMNTVLSLPRTLRIFYLCSSVILEDVLDLSELKNLRRLELWDCEHLREIQGLEKLECVEELIISECSSITFLRGLSEWEKVEVIELCECRNLNVVEDVRRLDSLKRLRILGCNLREFEISRDGCYDVPRSRPRHRRPQR